MANEFIVTTSDGVSGYRVTGYLGVVRGLSVRIPTPGQGFRAIGSFLGGDVSAGAEMYREVCDEARREAYRRLVEHAREAGADAIIAMRYDATDIGQGATEVLAYGTAVQLAPADDAS